MVNVADIQGDEIPTPTAEKDMLTLIFERQHHLATKYVGIEEANGLLQTPDFPVNIDSRKGQARLKDFAWRTMEELFEATDALSIHSDNEEHFLEEMIDAIHFFTELNLLCGFTVNDIKKYYEIPEGIDTLEFLAQLTHEIPMVQDEKDLKYIPTPCLIYTTIGQCIGNAMNKLKNKPWKQTHMVTDFEAFKEALLPAWFGFVRVLHQKYGLTAEGIFTLYFKKSEVNKFRIKSQY